MNESQRFRSQRDFALAQYPQMSDLKKATCLFPDQSKPMRREWPADLLRDGALKGAWLIPIVL